MKNLLLVAIIAATLTNCKTLVTNPIDNPVNVKVANQSGNTNVVISNPDAIRVTVTNTATTATMNCQKMIPFWWKTKLNDGSGDIYIYGPCVITGCTGAFHSDVFKSIGPSNNLMITIPKDERILVSPTPTIVTIWGYNVE